MPTSNENWNIQGVLTVPQGNLKPERLRSELAQEQLAAFAVNPANWRQHDAFATALSATAGSDDLGLVGGTFGSAHPVLQTGDLKAAGATTRRARALVQLPAEYDEHETAQLRLTCGMVTTIADTAATVDVEVYKIAKDGSVGSDLCTTAAQSINSLTDADKDFTINAADLSPGDVLDVRVSVLVNDAATVTAVIGQIGHAELLCDIRG